VSDRNSLSSTNDSEGALIEMLEGDGELMKDISQLSVLYFEGFTNLGTSELHGLTVLGNDEGLGGELLVEDGIELEDLDSL